jgi:hypothetical protein
MTNLREFASSSNGDRWFLASNDGAKDTFVLHRGNPASGGHETEIPVQQFLNTRPFGPEREALLAILGVGDDHNNDSQESYTSTSI